MQRCVEREWLDDLPSDDPSAIRSRRDLKLINRIMGSARVLESALRAHVQAQRPRIAELGAGDGSLMLRIARKLGWRNVDLAFVDQQPVVSEKTLREFSELGWRVTVVAADVFAWLRDAPRYDAIVASLFLHHFRAPQLESLFGRAADRAKMLVAAEPERARLPLAGSHLVGLLGCNDVTRHDAVLSVRAGFAGDELSDLWSKVDGWRFEEGSVGLFTHRFVAVRQ